MLRLRRLAMFATLCALVTAGVSTWNPSALAQPGRMPAPAKLQLADDDDVDEPSPRRPVGGGQLSGKLNLNTATPDQLQYLPGVGPSKAARVVEWRQKNGTFKRIADLRKVKGFGYKTLKKLEPYLDIKGDTTLTMK